MRKHWVRTQGDWSHFEGDIWPADLHTAPNGDGTWHWSIDNSTGEEFGHELNTGAWERECATEEDAQREAEECLWRIVKRMHAALSEAGWT